MSEYHLPYAIWGNIVLAVFFATLFLMVASHIIRTDVNARDLSINMDKVSAAFMAEACMKNGTSYINATFLEENKGKNVCDLCGICGRLMEVNVTELDSGREWKFYYSSFSRALQWLHEQFTIWVTEKHYVQSLHVSIKDGDEIRIGRLDVKI